MTDLTITVTFTLEEARALLKAAEHDVHGHHADPGRAVADRLAKQIEEAETEAAAYDAAAIGDLGRVREQLYQGPSRYAHPTGEAPKRR